MPGRQRRRVIGLVSLVLGGDHVVFLDALSTVLAARGYVTCTVAGSTGEIVRSVRRERPDVCIIDRPAVALDDLAFLSSVRDASSGTAIVLVSADPAERAAGLALDAGAAAYVHKSRSLGMLVRALECVLSGQIVVDLPKARPAIPRQRGSQPLTARLTCRERECLMLLVEGLSTAAMVERLGVSRTTVRTHLQSVLIKLGVHSRLEAASFAVRHGLPDQWAAEDLAVAASTVRECKPGFRRRAPVAPLAFPAPDTRG
jgi:two-component system, NarL family, nitrate/nitrite response regulator NarL